MIQRYSRVLNSDRAVVGKAVEDCMRAVIGVLLNLTHDNGQRARLLTSRSEESESVWIEPSSVNLCLCV